MKLIIETKSGEYSVECQPGQNVLFAGLSKGLSLPYECATGICGTCRCRIMDGIPELQWHDAPGLARVNIDKNESLMCQLRMRDTCKIRVSGKIEKNETGPKVYSARLIDLEKLTHDVARFSLQLDVQIPFKAGQFVVVEVDGLPGGRAYSMTNFGEKIDRLDFVIKRIPDGSFGDWLFDGWPEGAEVRLFGPLGRATFDPAANMNLLCIAGGSGIAGMMAILKHGIDCNYFSDHNCDLFFGVRTSEDIFFGDELNYLVEVSQNSLSVTVALSDEPIGKGLNLRYPSLKFAQGFVHSVASEAMKNRYENVCGYIAGPPPMVDAALRVLILEGKLSGEKIRYDKFS